MPQTANEPATIRVGLYIRVSTEMQAASGISVEEQELRLRAGVQRREGWAVAAVYIDDGYSGHSMDRPEVQRCLRDVAAGKLDKLIALDIDRAHRNEQNRRNFEQYLADHGVDMIYELEPTYDRLSMKNLSRGMRGVIAEYYSDWASETTRDKMIHMARTKRRTGGPVPFGLAIGADKQYIRDPRWFPTLLEIFTRRAKGESVRSIAKWLTDSGIPTPGTLDYQRKPHDSRGNPKRVPRREWLRYTVENILRNEAYHGVLVYNRSFGHRFNNAPKSENDIIQVEDAWEHFVPDDVWYQSQLRDLETSSPSAGPASTSTFALSNIVCLRCGHSMHGWTVNKYKIVRGEQRLYRYRKYRCTGRSNAQVCDAPMIRSERLEVLVIGAVAEYLQENTEDVQRLYEESAKILAQYHRKLLQAIAVADAQIEKQAAERARLVSAVAELISRKASDELIAQMDIAVQQCGEQIRQAEARQVLIRQTLQKFPGAKLRMDAFRASLDGMAGRLQAADLATQKRLLTDLVAKIEIDPDQCQVLIYIRRFAFAPTLTLSLDDDDAWEPLGRGPISDEAHVLTITY